jgi:hypothetical protein
VIYSYNGSQQDALFLKFILIKKLFNEVVVSLKGPHSCLLFRMCSAYADWGSFCLMYLMCP